MSEKQTYQNLENNISQLEKSEKFLKNILNKSQDLICIAGIDGYFKYTNSAWEKIIGYTQSELLSKPFLDFIHPEDHKTNDDEVDKLMEGHDTIDFENRYIHKNGSIRRISWRATPVPAEQIIYCIGRDITIQAQLRKKLDEQYSNLEDIVKRRTAELQQEIIERQQAEEALRESEKRFRALYNSSPDMYVSVSPENAKILLCNKTLLKKTGYSKEEVIGSSIFNMYHEECIEDVKKTFKQFVGSGQIQNKELILKKRDGKKLDVSLNVDAVKDKTGKILYSVSSLRDITNNKQFEKEKSQLETRLMQAQKMESIGNLAGGIAHDFNNLLFPIIGMSEMLLEDLSEDSLEYENAQEIFLAGKRAGDLVNQILAFSRQSEHKMTPVRVQNVLKEVLKLSRSTIPTNIELQQNIQQNCGLVMADPTQVHQVAMNLITNAFHAIEGKNGAINIELKDITLKKNELHDSTLQPGQYVRLSVSDNGIGMSQDTIHNIFEPYFTTKKQGKGTGLGLAVVYGIVKEHGGDIKVHSKVGEGTTFNVFFPLMKKLSDIISTDKVSDAATGTENILLVDDELPVVMLVKQMLKRLGYSVTEQTSSVDALNLFRENPNAFDLVISDMNMPVMTGEQLAKKIISVKGSTPFIICTGYSERINEELAIEAGIKGFLMKPIVKTDLARMVRNVLDKSKNS